MAQRLEIGRRVNEFRTGLDELYRSDEHRGEDRFFLYIESHRAANQIESALGRSALSTEQGNTPFFLLIAGESASGKTTLSAFWDRLLRKLGIEKYPSVQDAPLSQYISMDNYYRDNSSERAKYSSLGEFYRNFDVDNPYALNLGLAAHHINLLSQGRTVMMPRHDIATGISTTDAVEVRPSPFIIVEGLFTLTNQLTDGLEYFPRLGVFVNASSQEIRRRWFARIEQMAETDGWKVPASERPFYFDQVRGAAEEHVRPTKSSATIVVNGESPEDNRSLALSRLSGMMINALRPL